MNTRPLTPLAPLLLLMLFAGPLSGQVAMESQKGQRVEITYQANGTQVIVGLLHDVLENAYLVAPVKGQVVAVPRDQVTRIRVYAGLKRRWKEGLVRGTVGGAAAGALFVMMFLDLFGVDDGGAAVGAGAAYGAAYFGVMGAGVGFFIKEDRWENILLPNTFLSARPARFDLGISIPVRW